MPRSLTKFHIFFHCLLDGEQFIPPHKFVLRRFPARNNLPPPGNAIGARHKIFHNSY